MSDPEFLLDSDICIYALYGRSEQLKRCLAEQPAGSVAISSISLAEIGVGYGEAFNSDGGLEAFLAEVQILPFDAAAARVYAVLPFKRGSFDRLIAAHALALDATLITNNVREFSDVPNLRVRNWTRGA